jgi:hypothetical protein
MKLTHHNKTKLINLNNIKSNPTTNETNLHDIKINQRKRTLLGHILLLL